MVVTEIFDEQRFTALLDLAGSANAGELVLRLDEDLTRVAAALITASPSLDLHKLREHSHVLLAIAGTVGANRLFELASNLNARVRAADVGALSDLLTEIAVLLDHLIQRVRTARTALPAPS